MGDYPESALVPPSSSSSSGETKFFLAETSMSPNQIPLRSLQSAASMAKNPTLSNTPQPTTIGMKFSLQAPKPPTSQFIFEEG